MDIIDLFCGAGGLSLGFKQAGFEIVCGVDSNEDYLETYRENHTSPAHNVDLATTSPEEFCYSIANVEPDTINGVVGGPPCKGFSLAGEREQTDERNTLVDRFLTYVEFIQPEFVVMENVTGIKTMETPDGNETYFERAKSRLHNSGYTVITKTLNAADFGVPQNRERVFIIGFTSSQVAQEFNISSSIDETKTVSEALKEISPDAPNQEETNHTSDMVERLDNLEYGESLYDNYTSSWKRIYPKKPAPTIKENHGAPFVHPEEPRVGTVRECAKLQSFPDDFEFKGSKSTQLKTVGNAVPPQLAKEIALSIQEALTSSPPS